MSQQTRQRYSPSDSAFRSHNHHNHHEAEHVYNSPQLTLDPSTLDLRPSSCDDISPSSISNPTGSSSTTPTGSLRISTYNLSSTGVVTRRKARAALEQLQIQTEITLGTQPADLREQHQAIQLNHPHSFHPNHGSPNQLHHQTSDMHDVQIQQGELQMHVDDHNQPLIDTIHHQPDTLTPHSHVCLSCPKYLFLASHQSFFRSILSFLIPRRRLPVIISRPTHTLIRLRQSQVLQMLPRILTFSPSAPLRHCRLVLLRLFL